MADRLVHADVRKFQIGAVFIDVNAERHRFLDCSCASHGELNPVGYEPPSPHLNLRKFPKTKMILSALDVMWRAPEAPTAALREASAAHPCALADVRREVHVGEKSFTATTLDLRREVRTDLKQVLTRTASHARPVFW